MENSGPEELDHHARLTAIFDRLLEGADLAATLAAESDPKVRAAAEVLWQNHLEAVGESFLGQSMQFQVLPVFQPGQVLMNRFAVERMLGGGGMGEVYLASDNKLPEKVALKTIARLLVPSETIRKRFLTEVQIARRVTHPNVCRIHDLFEDGETAFFSMEYLDGPTLSSLLEGEPITEERARQLVHQLAMGLHAAHENGVVHGDFKPGNVMVVSRGGEPRAVITDFGLARALTEGATGRGEGAGGTLEYMAPELLHGAPASVSSDIFAFGKVAERLLPGKKMWQECTRPDAAQRTASLADVLASFQPGDTRRYWIGGALLVASTAVGYTLLHRQDALGRLPVGSRLMVNGFRANLEDLASARLIRSLLVTALMQSPRIRAISDQDLLPSLRHLVPGGNLPAEGDTLRRLITLQRASYWMDASHTQAGGRYSLDLTVTRSDDRQVVLQTQFQDLPSIAILAQQAAIWLREQAGETPTSLTANPATASSYTSVIPEALQSYFDAMNHYAVGEMAEAIPLLREAIRLDPQFCQAYNILAMCLNSFRKHEEAFQAMDRAIQLSKKLPERERVWVETNYYMMVEDPERMLQAARQNVAFFPDEPRFYRILGHVLCRTGNAIESPPPSRKGVELAPQNELQWTELIVNLCEAGLFTEGLQEFRKARDHSVQSPFLERGAGLAYLGLEDYPNALQCFAKVPGRSGRLIQGAKLLSGDVESGLAGLQQDLAEARARQNQAEQHQVHEFFAGTYVLAGQIHQARPHVQAMADLPPFPPFAKQLQSTAFWAARVGEEATLEKARAGLVEIENRWPNGHTHSLRLHANALGVLNEGKTEQAASLLLESLGVAPSIWALFDLADLFTRVGKFRLAEEYWQKFESRRGTVLKLWFPGTLIYGWLGRAIAAEARQDRPLALSCAKRVLDHWGGQNPSASAVQKAQSIYNKATL